MDSVHIKGICALYKRQVTHFATELQPIHTVGQSRVFSKFRLCWAMVFAACAVVKAHYGQAGSDPEILLGGG